MVKALPLESVLIEDDDSAPAPIWRGYRTGWLQTEQPLAKLAFSLKLTLTGP